MLDEVHHSLLRLPDGKEIRYLVDGLKWAGFKSDDPCFDERLFKYFEEMNSRLKYLNVKSGDVMIDVGASIGSWSLHAAIYGCKVYAFEVGKPQLKVLDVNARINGLRDLIVIYDCALHRNDDTCLAFDTFMALKESNKPEVSSISLDTWVKQNKIERIDVIKIDVEGMEYDVLLGSINTLRKFKPRLIIEIHDKEWKAHTLTHKIVKFLSEFGYQHEHEPPYHDYFF